MNLINIYLEPPNLGLYFSLFRLSYLLPFYLIPVDTCICRDIGLFLTIYTPSLSSFFTLFLSSTTTMSSTSRITKALPKKIGRPAKAATL